MGEKLALKIKDEIPDEDIVKIEIPTGKPILLEFNDSKLELKKYI